MTYLSFHCFLQMYYFVPYASGTNIYVSCVLCITILFVLTMTVCGLGLIAHRFKSFEVDSFSGRAIRSYVFLSVTLSCKFGAGFIHAYLDNPFDKALGLLITNTLGFIVLMATISEMEHNVNQLLYCSVYGLKALLHLQIFL